MSDLMLLNMSCGSIMIVGTFGGFKIAVNLEILKKKKVTLIIVYVKVTFLEWK